MKREIEFRGKTAKGEWVYGLLDYFGKDKYCIRTYDEKRNGGVGYQVDENTISQFTGVTDKNGKKIFEGDIVWGDTIEGDWHKGVVEYDEDMGCYFVNAKSFMQYEKNSDSWSMLGRWTVEGNIFDKESDNGD